MHPHTHTHYIDTHCEYKQGLLVLLSLASPGPSGARPPGRAAGGTSRVKWATCSYQLNAHMTVFWTDIGRIYLPHHEPLHKFTPASHLLLLTVF